jgi:hypothetical protein
VRRRFNLGDLLHGCGALRTTYCCLLLLSVVTRMSLSLSKGSLSRERANLKII